MRTILSSEGCGVHCSSFSRFQASPQPEHLPIHIIGIDCATKPKNMGVALATYDGTTLLLQKAAGGVADCLDSVSSWLSGEQATLLALDAPLGWPEDLQSALSDHEAGAPLPQAANVLFSRWTDRFIHKRLGKKPLEVGANWIARTAHAALAVLENLRRQTGETIPLAWKPRLSERVAAIEVYPAGTLLAHGLPCSGYKNPAQEDVRREIVDGLAGRGMTIEQPSSLVCNADALDAAICTFAAKDFLDGRAAAPDDDEVARREGWIWCLDPEKKD